MINLNGENMKYDYSWAQIHKPEDQKFELVPALIVLAAAEMIVILGLIKEFIL
jgi:hypothetical protein